MFIYLSQHSRLLPHNLGHMLAETDELFISSALARARGRREAL